MTAAEPPSIHFDADAHVYTVDGIVRPSVTQVLSGVGLIDDRWYTDEARARGSAVHAACHYLDEGDLDWSSVAAEIRPYLSGWEKFKADTGVELLSLEQPVYNSLLGFAGTLDRKAILQGLEKEWILDIKTGGPEDWHRLQLAAYAGCQDKHIVSYQRATVHLSKDGKYALRPHPMRNTLTDWADFQAALRVYGLTKKRRV